MRTTLNLDRDLLEEAKEVLGTGSFTEAIETALREAVARARSRESWNTLLESEVSWNSVEELLEHRRRLGGRSI